MIVQGGSVGARRDWLVIDPMQSSTVTLADRRAASSPGEAGGQQAPGEAGGQQESSPLKRWAAIGVTVLALGLAAFLLHRTFSRYSFDDLVAAVASVPVDHLLLAGAFAAGSYACLTCFDGMAVRYVDHRLPYPKVALASFLGLSIGHTVGMAALSSGMIRYRFYARWGLSNEEVAKVILFCGATVAVGLVTLGGAGLLFRPDLGQRITGFGQPAMLALGAGCLLLTTLYVALSAFLRHPLRIWKWSFQMPSLRLALGQVLIGTANFMLVAACLHQTLSAASDMPYLGVAAIFVIANITSLISHVPGGLGVIESVVLYLMPGKGVIGGLIAFRCIYFFIPLVLGGSLFAVTELVMRARGRSPARPAERRA